MCTYLRWYSACKQMMRAHGVQSCGACIVFVTALHKSSPLNGFPLPIELGVELVCNN